MTDQDKGASVNTDRAGELRSQPATPSEPVGAHPSREESPSATLVALHQYRNDMMYPPEPDSRERRIAMIDELIAGMS